MAAPAMDVDEDGGGGAARNQSSMVVMKSEAACTNNADRPVVDPEPVEDVEGGGDTTEYSSSFSDTCSGFQDAAGDGEPEVNSGMFARANGGRPWEPPRKKVTVEWRNYVRPILWRCQWLELRMKELSSQVSKYDRELALNKKQKELHATESLQIRKVHGHSLMKRRKRKRHEENLNTPLYINKHQILSYYHDKQNKGAETDGLIVDGDCGNTGGLDSVTLLDSMDCDVIIEQLSLKDILLTIDGVQSRVHLLQNRLRRAYSEGRNLAFTEGNTHVRVAWKRQDSQKHSSYTECRYTKTQKKKNLNALLKDDNGPALSGRPLPDRETDTHIKDANRIAKQRSGSREKAITMDLLLGIGNSIPNGYINDLCKETADDILIDNKATSDVCQQFDTAKHLPSGASIEQNTSAPVEVKNTCAAVKVDSTCAPVKVDCTCAPVEVHTTSVLAAGQESSVKKSAFKEPVSSGSKQEPNSKKKRKKGSLFTRKKQRKEASKTPAAKKKTEGTPSSTNTQAESTPSAVAKQEARGTRSAATGPQTMTSRSAGKKRKSVNEPVDAKDHGSGNLFTASMEQKTWKPSPVVKQQKTESSSRAGKEKTEGMLSAANAQSESTPSAVAKQETKGTRFVATGPRTMTARSAGKKRKSVNEPADTKAHGSWNLFSALVEQKTGNPSPTVKKQKTETSSTAGKEKAERTPSTANTQSECTLSAVAKQKTKGTCSAVTGPRTMTARSAGKKHKSVDEHADAKEHGSGNLSSALMEQKTGKPSPAVKKQKTETLSTAAKEKAEGTPSAANTQSESTPSAIAKQETKGTRSAATGPRTMIARSSGKKHKSVNEPADTKAHGSGNLFSALMKQKTGKPSPVVKKQKTETSSTAGKEKAEGTPLAANTQSESVLSAVAKQGSRFPATGPRTMTARSAGKKRKSVNELADAKDYGSGNLSSASMEQKTGKSSSVVKEQKTETLSTDAKKHGSGNTSSASMEQKTGKGSLAVMKQETESSSAAANKQEAGSASTKKKQATENSSSKATKAETAAGAPSKLQVEKAVDGRRSQRVRKPKVFAE